MTELPDVAVITDHHFHTRELTKRVISHDWLLGLMRYPSVTWQRLERNRQKKNQILEHTSCIFHLKEMRVLYNYSNCIADRVSPLTW